MKKILSIIGTGILLGCTACAQPHRISSLPGVEESPIAFPGAEGFGKFTTGGRGGKVYVVNNLDDHGAGSFREAAEAKGKRVIVFAVAGTIHLDTKLSIRGDVTIAGQSAPGDGVCIADNSVSLGGDNIIVRYLRFRMGDKYQKGGMVDGNGGDDAFGGTKRKNIIIDHCSMSWSTDEVFSVYAGDSTTLQWNIISEPLNYSYHFENGDKDYEHHGYGAIWGGLHLTAHHNLFAHCNNRCPRFNGIRHTPTEFVDYRNNVIYDWGSNNIYAGEGGTYNIVNNYFKYGPETKETVKSRICNPGKNETIGFGKWYVGGNYVDGAPDITSDNRKGVQMGNNGTDEDKKACLQDNPFLAEPINDQSAKEAYMAVLSSGGCNLPTRDTLDLRILKNVVERKGSFIDVQGGYPHGTEYEVTKNAWPALRTGTPPADSDKDGMPDAWELANGLNPSDPTDAAGNKLHPHYTNIEMYLNSLVK